MSNVEKKWQRVIDCQPDIENLFNEIEIAIENNELSLLKPETDPANQEIDYVEQLREVTKTIGFLLRDLEGIGHELGYENDQSSAYDKTEEAVGHLQYIERDAEIMRSCSFMCEGKFKIALELLLETL